MSSDEDRQFDAHEEARSGRTEAHFSHEAFQRRYRTALSDIEELHYRNSIVKDHGDLADKITAAEKAIFARTVKLIYMSEAGRAMAESRYKRTTDDDRPPPNLSFLIALLASPDAVEAVLGDLDEGFVAVKKRFGHKRAVIWYVGAVIRSTLALVPQAILHATGIAELVRKVTGR